MRDWNLQERLVETLGAETVLEEVLRYLPASQMNEYLEDMARLWEVEEKSEAELEAEYEARLDY